MKRGGGRRYYRPDDVELLRGIRHLLYGEGYTIRGVQRILREQGAKFVQVVWQEGAAQPPHGASDDEEFIADAVSTDVEPVEESRGLRGRLTSLIGRDLGEREDAVGARREPPLQSAPVPRIDPTDRAIFGAAEPEPPTPEPPMPEPAPPVAQPAPSSIGGGLARDDVRKLHAVLHELAECRKLIETAVAHAE
jgi:DNA-binding transcriptional MerR regulator